MFKSFMIKKTLEKHLQDMPPEQREKIEQVVKENPELFVQIAQEVQEEMQNGKSQAEAFQEVAKRHHETLKDALT